MLAKARLLLLLTVASLLGACASHTPPPPPEPVPEVQQVQPRVSHDVLFRALGLVGTPYRYGGNTPDSGFDCSGLIGYVYRDVAGISLPRTTLEMKSSVGRSVARQSLKAGDLVFFATNGRGRVSHAGIYVGEGRFVHAPSTGGTVRLDDLADGYWQKTYLGARRVLESDTLARHP